MANLATKELVGHGCTEPRKVLLAGLLWKKTAVSQAWIVAHLGMKNAANVSRVIHRMHLSQLQEKFPGHLRRFVSEKMKENEHCPLFPKEKRFFELTLRRTSKFATSGLWRRAPQGEASDMRLWELELEKHSALRLIYEIWQAPRRCRARAAETECEAFSYQLMRIRRQCP